MERRELEKRLKLMGWRLIRRGRKHDIWIKGGQEIAVPRHNEINEYTAQAIFRRAKEFK